jgi:ERCC4-type nuclease
MKLIIDCREKELIKQINQQVMFTPQFKKIEVIVESLPIGDILINNDNNETEIIIERKTIPDLLSSIKDGRYEEQSYRLNGIEHHNHNIMYLIEGDTNNKKFFNKVDKFTFYSALLSLNMYKGFSVIKTQNLTETATFICNSLLKIEKNVNKNKFYTNKTPPQSEKNNSETDDFKQGGSLTKTRKEDVLEITEDEEQAEEKDYVHVVKKVKKENITTGNIDEIMLSQIPGISSTIAIAIIQKFKSIKHIIEEFNLFVEQIKIQNQEYNQDHLIKALFNDISYINTKGDKRKITKTSMNNLYKFILENK